MPKASDALALLHSASSIQGTEDVGSSRRGIRTPFRAAPILRRLGLYGLLACICIYSVFPIYWMMISSLRTPQTLFTDSGLLPHSVNLESYSNLLNQSNYVQNFVNSAVVAFGTVALSTTLSIFIAYGATRLRFRGKTLILSMMLYAYMFPPLMLAIPMSAMFRNIGFTDSLWSLLIAHVAISLPLAVWLLWGFFKAMPFELEEAAMVDGCTQFGAFIRVVLPVSLPGIITVGIFSFLLSWTDYVFALILILSDSNKTMPLQLGSMLGAQDLRWGEIMAGSSLVAMPLFVMFILGYRYFVAGLSAGALKG